LLSIRKLSLSIQKVQCSFAKSGAFRRKSDLKNGDPESQQVWYVKEPSLLKATSVQHRFKFAALSSVMVTAAR
jgi:hypothetical protein